MLQQRFEDEEALRREHMTDEEARAVVELWSQKEQERERLASMPSVGDMAEGLQVPVEVAQELLAQVRQRNAQTVQHTQVRRTSNRSALTAVILAALIAIGIALLMGLMVVQPQAVPLPPQTATVVETAPATPAAPPAAGAAGTGATRTAPASTGN